MLKKKDSDYLSQVGYEEDKENRSGSFLIQDSEIKEMESMREKVELLPLKEAMEKYDWLKKEIPDVSEEHLGYFMRVKEGEVIETPIQTGFYMKESREQITHNYLLAERDSEVRIVTGCTASIGKGKHVGVSKYDIKEGAKVSVAKVHHWPSSNTTRSIGKVKVGKEAQFISNYVAITPIKEETTITDVEIEEGGVASMNSLVLAREGSEFEVKGQANLKGKGARASILSRAVSKGGKALTDEKIIGNAEDTKGHIECDGLLLNDEGQIDAVPRLEANNSQTDLSHEAAVGKISQEELNYLMARGIGEEDAKSLILQGFLDVELEDLPEEVKRRVSAMSNKLSAEGTA